MKNQYRFSALQYQRRIVDSEKEPLFSQMLQLANVGIVQQSVDSLAAVPSLLTADDYYIAHRLVGYKGKQQLFHGELVQASRQHLLMFLQQVVDSNDLRALLIAPVFQQQPDWVLTVSEELYCQLCVPA